MSEAREKALAAGLRLWWGETAGLKGEEAWTQRWTATLDAIVAFAVETMADRLTEARGEPTSTDGSGDVLVHVCNRRLVYVAGGVATVLSREESTRLARAVLEPLPARADEETRGQNARRERAWRTAINEIAEDIGGSYDAPTASRFADRLMNEWEELSALLRAPAPGLSEAHRATLRTVRALLRAASNGPPPIVLDEPAECAKMVVALDAALGEEPAR